MNWNGAGQGRGHRDGLARPSIAAHEFAGINRPRELRDKPAQLRGGTPAGVVQELYSLSLGHYVTQALRVAAAKQEDVDPDRVSFTGALRVLRCRLPECDSRGGESFARWVMRLLWKIALHRIEPRRNRINPRVVKQPFAKYPKKQPRHRPTTTLRKSFLESVVMTR